MKTARAILNHILGVAYAPVLTVALLGGILPIGCSPRTQQEPLDVGGETNWLRHCEGNADCAGDFDCLCGVCTLECATTSTNKDNICKHLTNGKCTMNTAAPNLCSNTPQVTATCTASCESDSDCAHLDELGSCEKGRCVQFVPQPLLDCKDLNRAFCLANPDCSVINGAGYDPTQRCVEPSGPMGCQSNDASCDDALTYALSPEGAPVEFSDSCIPESFTKINQPSPLLPNEATSSWERCEYNDCENKACGEYCTYCSPFDTDCAETDSIKTCDLSGTCTGRNDTCPATATFECGLDITCNTDAELCLSVPQPPRDDRYECMPLEDKTCEEAGGYDQNIRGACFATATVP